LVSESIFPYFDVSVFKAHISSSLVDSTPLTHYDMPDTAKFQDLLVLA